MQKFNEFISEAKRTGSGLHVFDIDDTLFHTSAKVRVMHGDKHVHTLSSSDYNTYKLQPGHHYDYSEFRSSNKFSNESEPMHRMLAKMRAIHRNVKKSPGSKVIINTARADFDNKDQFLNAFRKHGVDIDNIHVHRAGNLKIPGTIGERKAAIIHSHLMTGGYKRASLYDDSVENLQHFLMLKRKHPDVQFKAYHVKPNGSVSRHHK